MKFFTFILILILLIPLGSATATVTEEVFSKYVQPGFYENTNINFSVRYWNDFNPDTNVSKSKAYVLILGEQLIIISNSFA